MTASAVSTYINQYGVCPGRQAVVFTNNDSAYRTALDLNVAGAKVVVVDSRVKGGGSLPTRPDQLVAILDGHVVCNVIGRGSVKVAGRAVERRRRCNR